MPHLVSTPASLSRTVRAPDGLELFERTWRPPPAVPARGAVLLVHGLGEHSGRYEEVAARMTALGLLVRAWDQRGFGRSLGRRGALPYDDALLDDARAMFDALAREMAADGDARPPFVLGHSMGGGVVARAVTGGWIRPRGMMLSSPALRPRISRLEKLAARAGRRVLPGLQLPHRLPLERVSHDPAVGAALRADPLAHDRVTPRLVAFMLDAGARAIADAPRCRVPTLVQVAGDDAFVRPDGALRFHAALPPGVGTLHVYETLAHEIFNERLADRARVFRDLVAWIEGQLGSV